MRRGPKGRGSFLGKREGWKGQGAGDWEGENIPITTPSRRQTYPSPSIWGKAVKRRALLPQALSPISRLCRNGWRGPGLPGSTWRAANSLEGP